MSNELTLLQRQAIGKMLHTLRCVRQYSLLIGTWEQPNITLDFIANGQYHYLYKEDGYSNKQSCRFFADKDLVVLYGFYPQAYTPESKNERWTIRKLTSDSMVVYVHKATVVLDEDTLNMIRNIVETFTRK